MAKCFLNSYTVLKFNLFNDEYFKVYPRDDRGGGGILIIIMRYPPVGP